MQLLLLLRLVDEHLLDLRLARNERLMAAELTVLGDRLLLLLLLLLEDLSLLQRLRGLVRQ